MIVTFEAFTTAKVSEISRRSWDRLYPDHQNVMSGTQMVPETSVIFNQLTWPISPMNIKLERVCKGSVVAWSGGWMDGWMDGWVGGYW
jgi:hypothetical protein